MICDCHLHVFGPRDAFPLRRPGPVAQVPVATAADLKARCARLGIGGGIVINPVEYGGDTACLLDALALLGEGFRGVVMADERLDEPAMRGLERHGVMGFRLMFPARIGLAPTDALFDDTIRLARQRRWQLRLLAGPDDMERVAARLAGVDDVAIVLEHLALLPARLAVDGQPAYEALKSLQRKPNVWLQLSGARRLAAGPGLDDMVVLARRHLAVSDGRCVWGSDWPQPGGGIGDDDSILEFPHVVCPAAGDRRRLFAEEPARLLAFGH